MNRIGYDQRRRIYQEAIEKFGVENQLYKAVEEMSELTKEIMKSFRPGETTLEKLAEECGDTLITLEQLRMIFNMNDMVCEYMDQKVEKLAEKVGISPKSL